MLKKYLLTFGLVFVFCLSYSQVRVSGTVIYNSNQSPIIGATIFIEGTVTGAQTDIDGKYTIQAKKGDVLIFSFVGMKTKKVTVGDSPVINVSLEEDADVLEDVVVSALGLKRSEKSLGYSQTNISNEDLTYAKETDVVKSVAGKIAGVQILGGTSSNFSPASIRLRGVNSLTASGRAIFVVDDVIVSAEDINTDDIESLSVLKGPAATALYGSRGSNGVIVITSKSAKDQDKGWGIKINQSTEIGEVVMYPKFQNLYAGGYDTASLYADANGDAWGDNSTGKQYEILNYPADESWGPKIDGRKYRPYFTWYKDKDGNYYDEKEYELIAKPNNVTDFYETSIKSNTNISFSKIGDDYNARISYTNLDESGILPNSKHKKNYLSSYLKLKVSEYLTVNANLNYVDRTITGRPSQGYSPSGGNASQMFFQWMQRQVDIKKLRDYRKYPGQLLTWNIRSTKNTKSMYWDSPYFGPYENPSEFNTDKFYGNVSIEITPIENLKIVGKYNRIERRTVNESGVASGGNDTDDYSKTSRANHEDNYQFYITYEDKVDEDFSYDILFGGNARDDIRTWTTLSVNGGLTFPNFHTIDGSTERPSDFTGYQRYKVNSLYGTVGLALFKDLFFVNSTIRADWSSSLPSDNNMYLYPSVNSSFILSDLLEDDVKDIISYAKLRIGWGKVGQDVPPYLTSISYTTGAIYNGNASIYIPSTIPNQKLKPALSTSYELGTDLQLFENRFGLEFTFYERTSINQVIPISLPSTAGYTSKLTNAGTLINNGFELSASATIIDKGTMKDDFNWEITGTWGKSTTFVKELSTELKDPKIRIARVYWGSAFIFAEEGKNFGVMKGNTHETLQNSLASDENTTLLTPNRIMVGTDGRQRYKTDQELGELLPDFTGGLVSKFEYNGFKLTVSLDYQVGGQIASISNLWGQYSGLTEITAKDDIREHGVVVNGLVGGINKISESNVKAVIEKLNPKTNMVERTTKYYKENIKQISAKDYFKQQRRLASSVLYDASFIKVREVSLSYKLPDEITQSIFLNSMIVAFTVTNVGLLLNNAAGIDPSELEGAAASSSGVSGADYGSWSEGGQNPPVRSYGFNIKIGL